MLEHIIRKKLIKLLIGIRDGKNLKNYVNFTGIEIKEDIM